MKRTKLVIVGKTCSGKSTFAAMFKDLALLRSYITRPKRSENDNDYWFISPETAQEIPENEKMLCSSIKDGYERFVLKSDFEMSDIMILDPKGAKSVAAMLYQPAIFVTLDADESERLKVYHDRFGNDMTRYNTEREPFDAWLELISKRNLIADLTAKPGKTQIDGIIDSLDYDNHAFLTLPVSLKDKSELKPWIKVLISAMTAFDSRPSEIPKSFFTTNDIEQAQKLALEMITDRPRSDKPANNDIFRLADHVLFKEPGASVSELDRSFYSEIKDMSELRPDPFLNNLMNYTRSDGCVVRVKSNGIAILPEPAVHAIAKNLPHEPVHMYRTTGPDETLDPTLLAANLADQVTEHLPHIFYLRPTPDEVIPATVAYFKDTSIVYKNLVHLIKKCGITTTQIFDKRESTSYMLDPEWLAEIALVTMEYPGAIARDDADLENYANTHIGSVPSVFCETIESILTNPHLTAD